MESFQKRDKNGAKIFYRKLAFAVFATLTPHRQPTPKNGLRHFSALPTHHPKMRVDTDGIGLKVMYNRFMSYS